MARRLANGRSQIPTTRATFSHCGRGHKYRAFTRVGVLFQAISLCEELPGAAKRSTTMERSVYLFLLEMHSKQDLFRKIRVIIMAKQLFETDFLFIAFILCRSSLSKISFLVRFKRQFINYVSWSISRCVSIHRFTIKLLYFNPLRYRYVVERKFFTLVSLIM